MSHGEHTHTIVVYDGSTVMVENDHTLHSKSQVVTSDTMRPQPAPHAMTHMLQHKMRRTSEERGGAKGKALPLAGHLHCMRRNDWH